MTTTPVPGQATSAETVESEAVEEKPAPAARWLPPWRPTWSPTWRASGPWIVALVITGLYATISIARYLRYASESWDLGIFTEAIKQYAHFHVPIVDILGSGYNSLGNHFDPLIALLGPIFFVFPSPITLLLAQAALFGISAVPIIWLGTRRLGPGMGYMIGIAYGLSWGLQNAADFDFHEYAFAVPLIAFSLCALADGRIRAAVLWALPLLLVKEDLALVVGGIGFVLWLRGRTRAGVLLGVAGLAALVLLVAVVIPDLNPQHTYVFWQQAGGASPTAHHGFAQLVRSFIDQLFTSYSTKLHTLWLLLLATAFACFGSSIALIAVLPLLLRFASQNTYYWGTTFHYNAPLMPILFVAALEVLIKFHDRDAAGEPAWRPWTGALRSGYATYGAAAMLAVSVALADQFALNQFWSPSTMFNVTPRDQASSHAISLVPDGATVETTLDYLAPLAARTDTYWIGNTGNPAPQYVVYDSWNSGWSPSPSNPLQFIEQRHSGTTYRVIYDDQYGIYVLQKTAG